MKTQIDGRVFARMLISGAAAIEEVRQIVNELNVFPVPDGDTGTNMSQTMGAAARELAGNDEEHLGRVADIAASALLSGARGNSGVILSLLLRGFARQAKEWETLDGTGFAQALTAGVETAYRAVMKPAEGTILTVSRTTAARAEQAAKTDRGLESVLLAAQEASQQALAETIQQNPVLQKAGVIDAGGKGFCVILDGMLAALQGREIQASPTLEGETRREAADFSEYDTRSIKFGYCTELIIQRAKKKKDPLRLRAFLESLGDSIVMVDDEKVIKIHVHTNHPGRVLEESLTFGALRDVKIENMRLQHTEQLARQKKQADSVFKIPAAAAALRPFGFVSVAAGDGLREVFRDLGADALVEGGQTMNPSTDDILRAIDTVPAEVVFVLPNNKNIIMAAEQCRELSAKQVVVVPTKSIPQGISAMLAFDPTAGAEENREKMFSAIALVTTGQITYAARNSEFDGLKIAPGDHMALLENTLLMAHPDRMAVARRLSEEMGKTDPSFISVFYGQGADEREAEEIRALFALSCPDAEIQVLFGGQPVYYYLISAE